MHHITIEDMETTIAAERQAAQLLDDLRKRRVDFDVAQTALMLACATLTGWTARDRDTLIEGLAHICKAFSNHAVAEFDDPVTRKYGAQSAIRTRPNSH